MTYKEYYKFYYKNGYLRKIIEKEAKHPIERTILYNLDHFILPSSQKNRNTNRIDALNSQLKEVGTVNKPNIKFIYTTVSLFAILGFEKLLLSRLKKNFTDLSVYNSFEENNR